jgi:hypothetical protein
LLELPQLLDPNDAPLVENGVPGLYQPFGFKAAWTEWQGHMVNELNKRIAGRWFIFGFALKLLNTIAPQANRTIQEERI